jgi:LCP family protein required for cell wall assembly
MSMRKAKRRIEITRIITVVLAAVLLVSLALLFLNAWEKKRDKFPEMNFGETTVKYNGKEYALKSGIETFLVIGLDKYESSDVGDSYINDQQADFIMLLIFDNNAQTYTAMHINRDTMTDINVLGVAGEKIRTVKQQIALAHTYGNGREVSCRNTADAVSKLLMGVKVTHYMSVKLDAVSVYNDLVGGVEVEVLDDFTGIDSTLVKGEKVTLNSEQALTYVRTRYGLEDSSNQARMKRQKQYLDALREKTEQLIKDDDSFVVNASLKMADYLVSDRSVTQLQELMKKISQYEFIEFCDIEGELKVGEQFMEFVPDEEFIKKTVIDLFYDPKE